MILLSSLLCCLGAYFDVLRRWGTKCVGVPPFLAAVMSVNIHANFLGSLLLTACLMSVECSVIVVVLIELCLCCSLFFVCHCAYCLRRVWYVCAYVELYVLSSSRLLAKWRAKIF